MKLPEKTTFESHLKDTFKIDFLDQGIEDCRIEEITTGLKAQAEGQNDQFSVIFSSSNTQAAQQGVYQVSHSEMGSFELFLVPVFGDEQGVHYEAIFT